MIVSPPTDPLVSVIAICYNHQRFVQTCLDSIAAQTYSEMEIIVIDDCSTDQSVSLISSWAEAVDLDVTVIAHEDNRGICATRNEALALATGTYVACISTDDAWLPHKLTTQVRAMESLADEVAVLYSDAQLMDESGVLLPGRFIDRNKVFVRPPHGDIFDELLTNNFIPSLATLVRRRCLIEIGGYDEALIFEDWDMWLRLSRRFLFAFLPGQVATYRIVENSLIAVLQSDRKVDYLDSTLRIAAKHVGIDPRHDQLIRQRMVEVATYLDLVDQPSYLAFLADLDASAPLPTPPPA